MLKQENKNKESDVEEDLRNPAFAGLDGEESEHRVETVVIMEILAGPSGIRFK